MAINRNPSDTKRSEQNVLVNSYDEDFNQLAVEVLGFDGQALQRGTADALATKVTVSGADTYIGFASPGTAESAASWQCMKVAVSGGTTTILWADGNSEYDNISTDLTALTYS